MKLFGIMYGGESEPVLDFRDYDLDLARCIYIGLKRSDGFYIGLKLFAIHHRIARRVPSTVPLT